MSFWNYIFGPPKVEKLKSKGDVSALIKLLEYKKSTGVRLDAIRALGEVGDIQAVEPLTKMLFDESAQKSEIIKALEQIGGEKASIVTKTYKNLENQWNAQTTYVERTIKEEVQVGETVEVEKTVDTPPGTITKDWMLEYVKKPVYETRTRIVRERQYPSWNFEERFREELVKSGIILD